MPDEARPCPFCELAPARVVATNDLALALRDGYPVNSGHTLVVPRRHVATWFDATREEQRALLDLVEQQKAELDRTLTPDGYNLGINVGVAAGQTVMHLHLHLIPRFAGDVDDPTGGVRFVIPERGDYHRPGRIPRAPTKAAGAIGADRGGWREGTWVPPQRAQVLTTGGREDPFLEQLEPLLAQATKVDVLAAFVQDTGVREVADSLTSALIRGAKIRILTGDYLDITQESGLRHLLDLARSCGALMDAAVDGEPGPLEEEPAAQGVAAAANTSGQPPEPPGSLELRVVEIQALRGQRLGRTFHPKAWLLERPDAAVAFVGSSNLSRAALVDGVEWNLRLERRRDPEGFGEVARAYDRCWTLGREVDETWLDQYAQRTREKARTTSLPPGEMDPEDLKPPPEPHRIQREALAALAQSRDEGRERALVVLATGLGKTWLAAFDILRVAEEGRFPKTLFLAHRVELLQQASTTLRRLFPERRFSWFVGKQSQLDGDVVFASVAKLSRPAHLKRLAPDAFDYLIVDEVHHAHAASYRRILDHLQPKFSLGLTATPERADEGDVVGLFDDNLPYRANLGAGIEEGWLVPFAYFGLKDEVDYRPKSIPWRNRRFDPAALERAVQTERRMEQLWDAWQEHPGTRTLVFCCSIRHACFVRDWLRKRDVRVDAVFARSDSDDRAAALTSLRGGHLDAVCAIDLFNEGVDVPGIDRVVMLRPTESPVVFVQQLGRGLRKAEGKTQLTVIDFVGNHRVFLQRVRTLLSLAGSSSTSLSAYLRKPEAGAELPPGCSIDIELEAIELLDKLLPRGRSRVERAFRELLALRDERPTAGDLYRQGYLPSTLRKAHGSWFGFLKAEHQASKSERKVLHEAERRVLELPAARTWFEDIETTNMTRCFKMIVLEALLEREALSTGLELAELATKSHQVLARSPELLSDLDGVKSLPDPRHPDPRSWLQYWKKNPIHFWTTTERSGRRWFSVEGERFVPHLPVREGHEVMFAAMTRELVDYRLARYRARRRVEGSLTAGGPASFECKVTWNKRDPILKLPSRRNTPGVPSGELDVRLPDGRPWQFRLKKEFCNVARPVGKDRNALPDLLRQWFGPVAGKPGTAFHVRFRRTPDGWWVEPVGAKVLELPTRRGLVAYPTLRAAAGKLAEPLPDAPEPEVVALPGVEPSDDRFVVRATGDSMDGGAKPIRDGDWVVLRHARGVGLAAVAGRVVLVQSPDPVTGHAFQLKRIVQDGTAEGETRWLLRSDNPARQSYPAGAETIPIAVVERVVRPEDLAPSEGAVLATDEVLHAFGLSEPPGVGAGRVDGHLFLFLEDGGSLSAPDRVEFEVGGRRPGETAFVLVGVGEGRWRYCGVGRWLEGEGAWGTPALDFESWRAVAGARKCSRTLPAGALERARDLQARILAEAQGQWFGDGDKPHRVVGPAARGGLRVDGGPDGFRERTVSLTDLAWVLVARDEVERVGGRLDEARVNRLRYIDGTPKESTRWYDTKLALTLAALGALSG